MVNCKKNLKISLIDLRGNLNAQKLFFESVAHWISADKAIGLELVGTEEQIFVVKNVMLETKRFQDTLFNEGATLENVLNKLEAKHSAADSFSSFFGTKWVF